MRTIGGFERAPRGHGRRRRAVRGARRRWRRDRHRVPISRAMSPSLGSASAWATIGRLERRDRRGSRPSAAISSSAPRSGAPRAMRGDVLDQEGGRERLHRLPAVEAVAVMGGEEGEIAVAQIGRQLDRRREAAIERQHRPLVDAGEDEGLLRLRQRDDAALERGAAGEAHRSVAAVGPEEPDRERNDHAAP